MGPTASRPSAAAVVLQENLELTVPIVVNSAVRVRLRLLSVWWTDAQDAVLVNMARQRGKQLKRHVKIAVLEKPRTLLLQSVNRFAKIVSKVPTPTCQVCPVVKFASAAMRRMSRVHQIVPRVCPGNSMRTTKNFV
jgi:adenine-specific DNA glycosylase